MRNNHLRYIEIEFGKERARVRGHIINEITLIIDNIFSSISVDVYTVGVVRRAREIPRESELFL